EQGGFKTTDMVDCGNGYAVVYKSEINDSHAVGKVTVKEMMEQSSNIGFARSIEKVYRENQTRFTDFIDSLGLNQRASIQQFEGYMPIIKDPRLGHRNDWNDLTLTKMSYGYALELTPMHTLMLYNAVASGGKMLAPIIVKELRNGDEVVEQYLPEVINPQICSPQVLADVKECLEGVVENGTASLLKNDNYRVAGKTGTAQMVQPHGGYTARDGGRDYLGTLVGYFPAEAPKYTCIVAIKTHHAPGSRNTYYGGALAGPVFKAITDRIYALDNEWRERVTPTSGRGAEVEARVGGESQLALSEQLLDVRSASYTPATVESKQVIDTAELYTKDWRVMPSVMGMGLRDAIYTLERAGLSVEISGVGEVVEQTPLPEELYLSGDKATIRLAPRPEPEPDEKEKKNNRKI
ncbi:MAG: PASTA domain-containing protein, partial [Tidjanibacter sp.]|nr:PASTA domain-containing protein [Tidjanibacter sp.]